MQNTIKNFQIEPLKEAQYVKTVLAKYEQNGIKKSWEIVESGNSVATLIYHRDKEAFILVKQFRAPVYHRHGGDGMTVEVCAGLIDKDKPLVEIAKEEIEEECGYLVSTESIERITKVLSSVGTAGNAQTIYYVEVDESMRVSEGGGINDEMIEVFELPVNEAKTFMYDESIGKTPGLLFAFMWWFDRFKK
jgi:UDP-sugar diphosphatase